MELASQTLTRTLLATATLVTVLLAAAPARAGHRVVLSDGRSVEASTRPVIALGRVNFHDASGRAVSLRADQVDVEATRRALQSEIGVAPPKLWTAERLAHTTARLQVLGSEERAPEPSAAREDDGERSDARATVEQQRDVIERRIAKLQAERRTVPAGSARGQTLDQDYYLLQSELLRLRNRPDTERVRVQ